MTLPAEVGSFVVPGTSITMQDSESLGRGVIESNGGYIATVVGKLCHEDGVLYVNQKTDPIRGTALEGKVFVYKRSKEVGKCSFHFASTSNGGCYRDTS